VIHAIRLFFYRRIYAPLASRWDDFVHRNDAPLPAIPCQFCGKTDHKEKYCPDARTLGF
jgi:hypothetical protein